MNTEPSESDRPQAERRTGDRALVLLLVGCLLLTPPLVSIFQLDWRLFGIPFTGIYLFAVWGGLIAGTAILSRRLQRDADRGNKDRQAERDEREGAD
jgi:hypothetical protein